VSGVILHWYPEAFKRELLKQVANNGEYVGQFVKSEAQQNLRAITDPDWGRQYRGYVASLMAYTIEIKPREVVITVGVRIGYTRWHGFYIEMGTHRRAEHPFLRPAVFDNRQRIAALIQGR
jgi:hypothetical protein